jgi:hypothetical protein
MIVLFTRGKLQLKSNFMALSVVFSLSIACFAQHTSQSSLDRLKSEYPFVCEVPIELETAVYSSLSNYPELQNNPIRFKQARISTTLNARPTLGSLLFIRKENRRYVVRINSTMADSIISVYHLSETAKKGILGHEFAHFADYETRNFWQVLGRAFSYLSKKRKARFEKAIDTETIKRGLGQELYAWSYYVLYESNATVAYKNFKRETYLTPEEINSLQQQFTSTTPK